MFYILARYNLDNQILFIRTFNGKLTETNYLDAAYKFDTCRAATDTARNLKLYNVFKFEQVTPF